MATTRLTSLIRGDDHATEKLHHGTTEERQTAFRQGFKIGLSLDDAAPREILNAAWAATSIIQ
ncbi:putative metalloprotease [Bradyrhizobium sp. JR6.1]